MGQRTEHEIKLIINNRTLNRVIIDQHYREKHADSVSDQIILDLVKMIDGEYFDIEKENGVFQYFTAAPVFKDDKPFKLVLLLCICDDYLGVINAYRINKKDD